jgi:Spx/MgsR family transcriptional regulator
VADARIYLYSNCTSCKKAEAALLDGGVTLDRRDIFKEKLQPNEIRGVLNDIGKTAHEVMSTRSIPYRELDLANRVVSEDELVDLMSQHPGLLKRPIIIGGGTSLVGFNKGAVEGLIATIKQG